MDKSSPVFENFENKMSAMQGQGGPKINRSTFKIGSGGLETRVANNEKKITTLKNIFKAQKVQIGEKLTPKVNVLEESLIRTNAIITDVAAQLEKDFSARLNEQKKLLKQEQKRRLSERRDSKESRIETKKLGGFLGSAANKIVAPFKNIFQKLLDFGKLFLAGVGVNAAFRWLADPQNLLKFQKLLNFIVERPLLSLAAFGGTVLMINTVISKIINGLGRVVFTLLNPMTYVDLFSGKTFRNFLPKMKKLIDKAGRRTTKGFLLKKVAQQGIKKTGIKALGALPLIGNFIDIGSAIYRFSKGDVVGGFLSLGSAIPVLGWGIAAIDIAREFGAFEGSILQKQQKPEGFATGTKGLRQFEAGDTIQVHKDEQITFGRRTSAEIIPSNVLKNLAYTSANNFGTGPKVTTVTLPPEFVNLPESQTEVTETKEETPFLSTTDGSNYFIAERVTSIGGVV